MKSTSNYNQDHLGNNREVVDSAGTVRQITHYYPFGTPYADPSTILNASLQPYKYNFSIEREKRKLACSSEREKNRPKVNGKELDKMHGLNTYDYGARQYNPVTGRWDRMDPLCEKYYDISPYAYCGGNPVNRIDPDGMYFDELNEKRAKKIETKAGKRAARLNNQATRKEMRGKDPCNLRERAKELQKTFRI